MKQYLELLKKILAEGQERSDRTGVGTLSLFAPPQLEFDLSQGFPLITTKKVNFEAIREEMLWMLSGSTNVKDLNAKGVHIWDKWADEEGELGPVYGALWRKFGIERDKPITGKGLDQIKNLQRDLAQNPFSRRHILSAWDPWTLNEQKLPPCPCLFQLYVRPEGGEFIPGIPYGNVLDAHLYIRSSDAFLGLPFDIAGYALLLSMLAAAQRWWPRRLIVSFGDVHIYKNHIEQVKEQLTREPRPLPVLNVDRFINDILEIKSEHITLVSYDHHPAIKAPIAV